MKYAEQGCALLVEVQSNSEHQWLFPIALNDKFKKEGLQINFNYRLSRAPQGECNIGQTAVLEKVRPVE